MCPIFRPICAQQPGLAQALADGFPVSPGHTLIVTRRPVAIWFNATPDEQQAMLEQQETVNSVPEASKSTGQRFLLIGFVIVGIGVLFAIADFSGVFAGAGLLGLSVSL